MASTSDSVHDASGSLATGSYARTMRTRQGIASTSNLSGSLTSHVEAEASPSAYEGSTASGSGKKEGWLPSSIDEFVHYCQTQQTGAQVVRNVVPLIKRLERYFQDRRRPGETLSSWLSSMCANGADPLDLLAPPTKEQAGQATKSEPHSLAFILVLQARLETGRGQALELPLKLSALAARSYSTDQLAALPGLVTSWSNQIVRVQADSARSAPVLLDILHRWCRHVTGFSTLTGFHVPYLYHALRAGQYAPAASLLETAIMDVDNTSVLGYRDNLLYHLYGGIILTATGRYELARRHFERAISAPALTASAIQIDAYQKLSLLHLISSAVDDKALELPKYTSPAVTQAIRNQCSWYSEFSGAYLHGDVPRCQQLVHKARSDLSKAGNWGLAQQCLFFLDTHAIRLLSKHYISVPLATISHSLGYQLGRDLTNLATRIQAEIERRTLHARFDRAGDGNSNVMLIFLEDGAAYDSKESAREIQGVVTIQQEVIYRTAGLSNALACDPETLKRQQAAGAMSNMHPYADVPSP
ncbi:uncharacterized protein L969DRAFT_91351 [Mixia osmundae IAM 14324]|uniref:COP9 signalosome complex subunit 3 N-terminal helical repeats domain-containing protein n=1 Tax=Mixia osmundae (strain CBS 9802 / IAM 14324 / JCM 22182 / KY 12970) TaxID=764103 RepID=G7E3Q6_MIXOS|nr:uncharacterized protein L969DRAFT_91351 [Mixia osmundae IAM 14324]KEI41874.1 hypothetical protein L969DRAFT_91351 [Mixia osmundae IAM 14324]GAA97466.1 hypothetical protein E5Q_04145 [Mixia osmundae IAM 14324]